MTDDRNISIRVMAALVIFAILASCGEDVEFKKPIGDWHFDVIEGTFSDGTTVTDSMPNDCLSFFFCDGFMSITENSIITYTHEYDDHYYVERSRCDIYEDHIVLYHDEVEEVDQESVEYRYSANELVMIFTRTGDYIVEYLCKLSEYDGSVPPSEWTFD